MTKPLLPPILLSVLPTGGDIDLRIDTQPAESSPHEHVAHLRLQGCASIAASVRQLEDAIGMAVQGWPIEDRECTDTLILTIGERDERLAVTCRSVQVTWEAYVPSDLGPKLTHWLQRLSSLSERHESTARELGVAKGSLRALKAALAHEIEHGLDRAERKLPFFRSTNVTKAEITEAQIALYRRFQHLLKNEDKDAAGSPR